MSASGTPPKLRVLIIDDEEDNHAILKLRLKEATAFEIESRSAADGHSAIAAMRQELFDVAFLDYRLPDVDGLKLLEQIRQIHTKTAVIMMSAVGNEKVAVRAIQKGAIDYLVRSDMESCDINILLRRAIEMQTLQGENAELRQVNSMKDEFISSVSHELRTPLAVILGYAKSLEDGDLGELPPPQKKAVEAIGRRGGLLLEMLNRLLSFKDSTEGHQQAVLRSTDLTGFLQETLDAYREKARNQKIGIDSSLPEHPVWVLADPTLLGEALDNLLGNAVKFSPEGGRVEVSLETHKNREAWVRIVDHGRGIPPEALPRLFEGFFHTDKDLTREVSGLGLGLALARQTLELHGGRLWLESEGTGTGTSALIALPITESVAKGIIVDTVRKTTRKKVLVIEDNTDILEIIALFLAGFSENLVLTTTEHGQAGLEFLAKSRYDLLILDLMMPGMSGFDVLERLQRLPEEKRPPVLICSGHQEAAKQALSKGAKAFILKPFLKDSFLRKVLELLRIEPKTSESS